MKKIFSVFLTSFLCATLAHAQADHKLDSQTLANDETIKTEILRPALKTAREQNQAPDWNVLHTTIQTRFDASYADRNTTKAQIFFYYGRDWARFSTALVQYTDKYEWRDSLSLMNLNAKMILANSTNPTDWKAAQAWAKYATDKNPSNGNYRATYEALTAKISGQ
jgi:hypothetical protein